MLLPVPKIVFQVVAFGFEDIVILMFSFRETATRGNDLDNPLMAQAMVGDECIVVEHLSIRVTDDSQFTPVDELGGLSVSNAHTRRGENQVEL